MLRRTHLYLFLILLAILEDVKAAWKFSRKSRRHAALKYQNDAATYGPNVCAVQEVFKTGEKFYPDCVKKRLKKVCGSPTFVRYECCCGYAVMDGEEGCPALEPLKNVRDTLIGLGLKQFTRYLKNTELEYNLLEEGAFTVFVPVNEAFDEITEDHKQRLFPWTYNALSLVHYHVARGWHHSVNMKKTELLPSLYYGLKPVWITRASKKGMHTVNCARMIRSNILASNGVIHIIDKVLSPYDMYGNITELLFRDSGQFSQFVQVLYTSQLMDMIRAEGPFTMFAPNNYAFSRLPKPLLEKVLREQETAIALVRHHMTRGVYCKSANIDNHGIKMLDGTSKKFSCKKNGHYIHNSKLVKSDILAGNGVIHIINKVQLPHSIQTMESLARELQLNKFLQLSYNAGLLDKLDTGPETTLFVPSDGAFNDIPKDRKDSVLNDPTTFERLFDYHSSIGKIKTDNFVGDHGIIMNSGNIMKITVHWEGILMDDAAIISPNNECSNGIIHIIDKVLIPPETHLLKAIENTEDLSIYKKGLEYSGLAEMLNNTDKMFTVFAPSDQAFNKLPEWQFDAIFDDKDRVKRLMNHHIVDRILIGRSITPMSLLHITSLQGEKLVFQRGKNEDYTVNKYSDVLQTPVIAKNGVLYKIDRVLDCDCKAEKNPS